VSGREPSHQSEWSWTWGCRFCLFLWFFYWILEMFRQCGI